jgi:hypothetical protein
MYKLKREWGVFSDFNRIIDWFWYSKYTGCPIYVDWTDGDINLFEKIFYQKYSNGDNYTLTYNFVEREDNFQYSHGIENRRNSIPFYKKYTGNRPDTYGSYFYCTAEVYKEPEFIILRKELNGVFNEFLKFKTEFFEKNEKIILRNNFKNEKILGVHLRWPGHYYIGGAYSTKIEETITSQNFYELNANHVIEYFINNNFDLIYLATDCQIYSEILNQKLPNKIIQIPYDRVNEDWHIKLQKHDNLTEINNIFLDVYNLSNCNHFISAAGNITFGVCVFNTNLSYHLYPILENAYSG